MGLDSCGSLCCAASPYTDPSPSGTYYYAKGGKTRATMCYASDGSVDGDGLVESFCRNPDGEPTIWCYTMDPGKRFEECNELSILIAEPPACRVTSGTGCTSDGAGCCSSLGHPGNYGNNQQCTMAVDGKIAIGGAFNTEYRYDFLTVGGVRYHGTSGPPVGTDPGTVTWSSDYSVVRSGWKICGQPKCTPSNTEHNWRMWGTTTCQGMQDGWQVCSNPRDVNHDLVRSNCPCTCSKYQACSWSTHAVKYSGGYAGGVSTQFVGADPAKSKCIELGQNVCKAVTCAGSGGRCTVRAGSSLHRSPSGETTYVPSSGCFGCPSGYSGGNNRCPYQGLCCAAGWSSGCGESCARSRCTAAFGTWIPLDYWHNPYTCWIR